MTDYVKLEDGMLQYAPINGYGYSNFNQSVELMEKYGYKPFYPTESPKEVTVLITIIMRIKGTESNRFGLLLPIPKKMLDSFVVKTIKI